nr:14285_t:CDS:2 [Entrophospora candida]
MKINDFKGTDRWLSRFKNRHHIHSVTKQGESASVPTLGYGEGSFHYASI